MFNIHHHVWGAQSLLMNFSWIFVLCVSLLVLVFSFKLVQVCCHIRSTWVLVRVHVPTCEEHNSYKQHKQWSESRSQSQTTDWLKNQNQIQIQIQVQDSVVWNYVGQTEQRAAERIKWVTEPAVRQLKAPEVTDVTELSEQHQKHVQPADVCQHDPSEPGSGSV